MKLKDLPLDTWMVVEPIAKNEMHVLSTHATQCEAEAERDRRNGGQRPPRYSAIMALAPCAERMGGQPRP